MRATVISVVLWLALIFPLSLFPSSPIPPGLNDAAPISTVTREGRLAVFDDAWARIGINSDRLGERFRGFKGHLVSTNLTGAERSLLLETFD